MNYKKNISGIILAGGKSSRMGSDKGFLTLNGTTFISHIIETIKPLVNEIIIVSNNPDYDVFGYTRVKDLIDDAGPLAGVYSGLYHSKNENNLILSCDVPMINNTILSKLIDSIEKQIDIVQLQSHNKTMPLIAMYKRQCMGPFFKLLQNGERRLRIAVAQQKTKTILLDSDNEKHTININTISQLKTLRHEFED